jgi:murein DD-endopeptidase MepM/ murein hydrolase activator NlpD
MSAIAPKLAPSRLLTCPACNGPVEVKSRHVTIAGAAVRVYCSANCLRAGVSPPVVEDAPVAIEPAPSSRSWVWWIAGGVAIGATCLVMAYRAAYNDEDLVELPLPPLQVATPVAPVVAPAVAEPDPRREEEKALLEELARDAWIHPLAGPSRRMPINHNGAFGALRGGDRPPECISGHCGVDVGRVWGEPVLAVHDGVVEWVDHVPNDESGIFVKIAHRDGTLFSWYFHLAAVPRAIQRGVKVTAGQVIGLIGDTGVKQPAPHLHFSLSVKPSKSARERFLDPEPLIAIWPLWIPDTSRPSTKPEPGMPVRAHSRRKHAKPPPEPASEPAPLVVPEAAVQESPPAAQLTP